MATGTLIPPGVVEDDNTEVQELALSSIEEADRSHQVATARKYPRSITKFVKDLRDMTCMNQKVAEQAMYSLPRAGKQIVGPSVRFAEAAISCWGNVRAGVAPLESNMHEGNGYVVAEGRFYDCEKNVGLAMQVKRRNVGKKDPDGMQVTMAAASSIAFRNAALRGIPQALWGPIFDEAKTVAAGDVASFDVARADAVKLLNNMTVTSVRIFRALGVEGIKDIGRDEFLVLKDWARRLQAKEITIEELFGSPLQEEIEALMDLLKWNTAQRQMSNVNFRNSPSEQLAYLREEARKAGLSLPTKEGAPQSQTKSSPTATSTQSAESSAAPSSSKAADPKPADQPTEADSQAVTQPVTAATTAASASPSSQASSASPAKEASPTRPARSSRNVDW